MNHNLTKKEWLILRMYGGGMKLREVAQALGVKPISLTGGKGMLEHAKIKVGAYVKMDITKLIERGKLEWNHES